MICLTVYLRWIDFVIIAYSNDMKTEKSEEIANISLKLSYFLRYLRKKNNWTQEYLSEISTIDYKHIQRLESIRYNNDFRFSTLQKLSKAFDIDLLDFIKCIISDESDYTQDGFDSEWGKIAESSKKYNPD